MSATQAPSAAQVPAPQGVPVHLASDLARRIHETAIKVAATRYREAEAARLAKVAAEEEREEAERRGGTGGIFGSSATGAGGRDAAERDASDTLGHAGASSSSASRKSFGAEAASQMSIFVDQTMLGAGIGRDEEERQKKLVDALKQERSLNDTEFNKLKMETARIEKRLTASKRASESAAARRIREKETQIARMEWEIDTFNTSVANLGPDTSIFIRDVLAKGTLAATVGQLETELLDAEQNIFLARQQLASERQLLSDLSLVEQGMEARHAQLERRATQLNEDELIEQLREKLKQSESQLGTLLSSLIRTSNDLFSEDDAGLRPQLRSFLDALMNKSWDQPADPYVEINKYPRQLASFLIRANVAQEHPRDARRIRLIPFQKANRS